MAKKMPTRKRSPKEYLVFIDTNILLDFYRARGREGGLSILEHFEGNHERIITTAQVEMEYKKNRQRVIVDCLNQEIKDPKGEGVGVPSFLLGSQPDEGYKKAKETMAAQVKRLRERTARLLKSPSENDPVYQPLQRLFKAGCAVHLMREQKERFEIRRLARKRFCLGYPPRKDKDTSIGDAINWEWVVRCSAVTKKHIVIVSRDGDYGVTYRNESYLNDWLRQEFKERTTSHRDIILTQRLTDAFKKADIKVTAKEEEEEAQLVGSLAADRESGEDLDGED
ncbi:MAG: PIN domain-containing protein [Planctomycetota bacterium]